MLAAAEYQHKCWIRDDGKPEIVFKWHWPRGVLDRRMSALELAQFLLPHMDFIAPFLSHHPAVYAEWMELRNRLSIGHDEFRQFALSFVRMDYWNGTLFPWPREQGISCSFRDWYCGLITSILHQNAPADTILPWCVPEVNLDYARIRFHQIVDLLSRGRNCIDELVNWCQPEIAVEADDLVVLNIRSKKVPPALRTFSSGY